MHYVNFILFNLYLACWLGLYHLAFSRKITFKINRFLLLGGIVIAGILPFITSSLYTAPREGTSMVHLGTGSATVISESAPSTASALPIGDILLGIYWIGVSIMTFFFIKKLNRLYRYAKKFPQRKEKNYTHVILPENSEVFSFGNYLFAPSNLSKSIIEHEKVHILQKHSRDNIFLEILKIFCWFNPFIYLYQKTLRLTHEYLADTLATDKVYITEYAEKLVARSVSIAETSFVHPFLNHSHLQKRLTMLKKKRTAKKQLWTYFILLPLLAGTVFITSSFSIKAKLDKKIQKVLPAHHKSLLSIFNQTEDTFLKGTVHTSSGIPLSGVTIMLHNSTRGTTSDQEGHFTLKTHPGALLEISRIGYNSLSTSVPQNQKDLNFVLYPKPQALRALNIVGYTDKAIPSPAATDNSSKGTRGSSPNRDSKVFQFVEQMPQFPGGKNKLFQYFSKHIEYPTEAREQGIQGNVMVQFTVNRDGKLGDIKTIGKKLGSGLEEEAVRVVRDMPNWIPGRQNGKKVKVQYHLPIHFSLQGPGKESNLQQDTIPSSKVFQKVEKMPEFPGGQTALMKYLSEKIHYPKKARENNIQGTVMVQFIIKKDGSIHQVKQTGKKHGGGLEKEAVRVVKKMPKWIPGTQDGKKVNVQYTLPIRFTLQ